MYLSKTSKHLVLGASLGLFNTSLMAGGFEKALFWSGKYSGLAGAATSSVSGSEALYFNPAGLGGDEKSKVHLSLNGSPTWSQFKGPARNIANEEQSSDRGFTVPFGATASYSPVAKLGVGLGVFAAGGTKVTYKTNFASVNSAYNSLDPEVKSHLSVVETSLGAGYEVAPGLKLGAAWRVAFIRAAFSSVENNNGVLLNNITIDDLSQTKWNGFKLGAQYASESGNWGLGLNWRSQIAFNPESKADVRSEASTTLGGTTTDDVYEGTGTNTQVKNKFPHQISFGGHSTLIQDTLKVFAEYTWSNYKANKELTLDGSVTLNENIPAVGGTEVDLADKSPPQHWKDQSQLRLAFELTPIENWAFRLGYVFTSDVTPKRYARASFSSPEFANTVVAGVGADFLDDSLHADLALDYSWAKGEVTKSQGLAGDYSTSAYSAHTGVSYTF